MTSVTLNSGLPTHGIDPSGEFRPLLESLNPSDQEMLRKKIGERHFSELKTLSKETDPELYWEALLHFGQRLQRSGHLEGAVWVYSAIVGGGNVAEGKRGREEEGRISYSSSLPFLPSSPLLAQAQLELEAIQGKGNVGMRLEFLGGQVVKDSLSYKMVIPFALGAGAYQWGRTAALSRYAASAGRAWYERGLGARLAAGFRGTLWEAPVFAFSSRGLRDLGGENIAWDPLSMGKDVFGALIMLSTVKGAGFGGEQAFLKIHRLNELGAATRLAGFQKFSHAMIPQASMFGGMMLSHGIETELKLRDPAIDGATFFTDALVSQLSMVIGANVANRIPGESWQRLQVGFGIQANIFTKVTERRSRPMLNPSLGLAAVGPRGAGPLQNILMSSIKDGGGGSGGRTTSPMTTHAYSKFLKKLVKDGTVWDAKSLRTLAERIAERSDWALAHFQLSKGDPDNPWPRVLGLDFRPLTPLVRENEQVRKFLLLLDSLEFVGQKNRPQAYKILFDASQEFVGSEPWAVFTLHELLVHRPSPEMGRGVRSTLQEVDPSGLGQLARQLGPHTVGDYLKALQVLFLAGNDRALQQLMFAGMENPQAVNAIYSLAHDKHPRAPLALSQLKDLPAERLIKRALEDRDAEAIKALALLLKVENIHLAETLERVIEENLDNLVVLSSFKKIGTPGADELFNLVGIHGFARFIEQNPLSTMRMEIENRAGAGDAFAAQVLQELRIQIKADPKLAEATAKSTYTDLETPFGKLTLQQWELLFRIGNLQEIEPEKAVVKQGDDNSEIFFILEGEVHGYKPLPMYQGFKVVDWFAQPGNILWQESGTTHELAMMAKGPVKVLRIPKAVLLDLLRNQFPPPQPETMEPIRTGGRNGDLPPLNVLIQSNIEPIQPPAIETPKISRPENEVLWNLFDVPILSMRLTDIMMGDLEAQRIRYAGDLARMSELEFQELFGAFLTKDQIQHLQEHVEQFFNIYGLSFGMEMGPWLSPPIRRQWEADPAWALNLPIGDQRHLGFSPFLQKHLEAWGIQYFGELAQLSRAALMEKFLRIPESQLAEERISLPGLLQEAKSRLNQLGLDFAWDVGSWKPKEK